MSVSTLVIMFLLAVIGLLVFRIIQMEKERSICLIAFGIVQDLKGMYKHFRYSDNNNAEIDEVRYRLQEATSEIKLLDNLLAEKQKLLESNDN